MFISVLLEDNTQAWDYTPLPLSLESLFSPSKGPGPCSRIHMWWTQRPVFSVTRIPGLSCHRATKHKTSQQFQIINSSSGEPLATFCHCWGIRYVKESSLPLRLLAFSHAKKMSVAVQYVRLGVHTGQSNAEELWCREGWEKCNAD